jgi:hypothetical protein
MISIPKFGEVLFSGSRFVFWALIPFLFALAVIMTALVGSWHSPEGIIVVAIDVIVVLLILALYNPKRFWWAARGVTGIVGVAFIAFLIDEVHSGKPWTLRDRGDTLSALIGCVVVVLPCFRYTFCGRFTWKKTVGCEVLDVAENYGKGSSPSDSFDLSARVALLHSLESGVLDATECPRCHKNGISVWFTQPAENVYRTWFRCEECSFRMRAQNRGRPRLYSPARIDPELHAYDLELFAKSHLDPKKLE